MNYFFTKDGINNHTVIMVTMDIHSVRRVMDSHTDPHSQPVI